MNPDLVAHVLKVVPIGFISGLLSGAFGIGGGIVSVPLVKGYVGVDAHIAIGCSLALILPTAIVGAFNYLKSGQLLFKLAIACAIPAAICTSVTSYGSKYLQGSTLMIALSALMALVGLDFATGMSNKMRYKAAPLLEPVDKPAETPALIPEFKMDAASLLKACIIGALVGALSGLLGVGGGFIMVPSFCYFLELPLKIAFGTSLIVVAIVAIPGTIVHALEGHVQLWIVLPMLIGSLPGAWLGSYISIKTRDSSLRSVFGITLLLMAIYFAYREMSH